MPRRMLAIANLPAAAVALGLILSAAGCQNSEEKPGWQEVKRLQAERTELQLQVEKLQAENEQLTQRVDQLTAIGTEARIEALQRVSAIEISSRSGLYDEDENGTKETLIVYLRIIDNAGDAVKAPGSVDVQLWDLNAPENQALLGSWKVPPQELTRSWASTVMTSYYRLKFDVADLNLTGRKELTVKVAFTDYLTGKRFQQQAVISP